MMVARAGVLADDIDGCGGCFSRRVMRLGGVVMMHNVVFDRMRRRGRRRA